MNIHYFSVNYKSNRISQQLHNIHYILNFPRFTAFIRMRAKTEMHFKQKQLNFPLNIVRLEEAS